MRPFLQTITLPFAMALLFNSCSEEENKSADKFTIENDFEEITYWTEIPSVIKSVSRSGNYCTFTSQDQPYTTTLKMPYEVLKKKNANKISASAWIKSDKLSPSVKLVISVETPDKKYYWNGSDSTALSSNVNTWREIKVEGVIPPETPESAVVIFYGWNTGADFVLWDDFKLTAN